MTAASTRERILAAARQRVLRQGFAATTVDAILADAAVSKGAFFHHFPTKAHLGRALVQQYAQSDAETLDTALAAAEASSNNPAEQLVALLRYFEHASDAVLEEQPSCLFVSFIYETELTDAGTAEIVAASIRHWRRRLLDKIEEAARVRPLPASVDLPSLADQFFTVFEGAFLLARALGDPTRMRAQIAHLRRYVELLFGVPLGADDETARNTTQRARAAASG